MSQQSGQSEREEALGNALRDLGLSSAEDFLPFANLLSVPCCCCAKVSGVRYQEHGVGWIRRPALGTAFLVTCASCLAALLICYRAGNLVHVERMTGSSDLVSALQRAEERLSEENAQQRPVRSTRLPERATTGARQQTTASWHEKGEKELEVGRFKEAIACFDRALALNPNVARVWRDKGAALSRADAVAEAVACYTKSLELDALDPIAWFDKGTTVQRMGHPEEAVECFDGSIEIDGTDPDVWCNKAFALQSLGRAEEEISCYDKALELNQEHVEAWLNKGCTLAETSELRAAVQCFEKVLSINPTDADAWFSKAVALVNLRNRGEAAEAFERFSEVAGPSDPSLAQAKMLIRKLGAEP